MKEVVTEEILTKTTYVGNCPICGQEQISLYKDDVDKKCYTCITDERENALKHLIESCGLDIGYIRYTNSIVINFINFVFNDKTYLIAADDEDSSMEIIGK